MNIKPFWIWDHEKKSIPSNSPNNFPSIMLKIVALFVFIFCTQQLLAQQGKVRGFVYDKETGEPLLFTNVYLKGTTYSGTTDVNGYYSITSIPPGNYTIVVTSIGYESINESITINAGELVSKQLYIRKGIISVKVVEISGEKEAEKTEVRTSVTKVTPREIKMIPSVGGEADIAQYMQVLPGVVFSGDQGGQLYIRGGTPVMNKVMLDGMVIYNPFHSIGLFSVFDTDIIRNADIYTGGFNAEYGGRISSVMDITTRDGNKNRYAGKVSTNTFTSKLLFEGPLFSAGQGNGGTSFVFSARNSYLDKTSPTLYHYINEKGIPYNFTDLYGKVSFYSGSGSKLSLFGFGFKDNANYQFITNNQWKSAGGGFNFVVVPGNSVNIIDGNFAYSKYHISQQEAQDKPRYSDINGFNFDMNFTNYSKKNEVRYGFQVLGFKTDFEQFNLFNVKTEQKEYTTEFGGYVKYRWVINHLVAEPSLRIHFYGSLSETSIEPRIGFKYNITDKFRVKIAGGYYSQNLLSAVSDRDVVNLFYGFLSGPKSLPDQFNGKDVTSHLQKSKDLIGGIEADLTMHLNLKMEVYYKKFIQLTNINRDKVYPDNGLYADQPDNVKKDFIVENGHASGGDVVLKYDYKKLYIWIVYSLGYVDRYNGVITYAPHFDRRHNANLVTSYTFGRKLNWEINARWNFGSGFPFTRTAGFYELLNFNDGLYTDINSANGQLGISYGELNNGRLPPYHRLDLSLKKSIVTGKNSVLEITASVINVYDRQNIFYFDRIRYKRVDQLPILPAVGMSLTF